MYICLWHIFLEGLSLGWSPSLHYPQACSLLILLNRGYTFRNEVFQLTVTTVTGTTHPTPVTTGLTSGSVKAIEEIVEGSVESVKEIEEIVEGSVPVGHLNKDSFFLALVFSSIK